VIPPHLLAAQGRLLRLWVGAMMNAIMRRRARTETSTLFLLDEAAQLGPLDELRQAVTLLRGYGLQTWSFWQDASQLRHLYPSDWQTMVNNSKVVQCFGANTMVAASDMAAMKPSSPNCPTTGPIRFLQTPSTRTRFMIRHVTP